MAKRKERMSQKTKGLKKETFQSIADEATNYEILAKTTMSRGNMLKEYLNYDFDGYVELHRNEKKLCFSC